MTGFVKSLYLSKYHREPEATAARYTRGCSLSICQKKPLIWGVSTSVWSLKVRCRYGKIEVVTHSRKYRYGQYLSRTALVEGLNPMLPQQKC